MRGRVYIPIIIILLLTACLFAQKKITDFRLAPASALDVKILFGLNSSANLHDEGNHYLLGGSAELEAEGKIESEEQILTADFDLHYAPFAAYTNYADTSYEDESRWRSYLYLREKIQTFFYLNKTNVFISASGNGKLQWQHYEEDDGEHSDVSGKYSLSGDIGFGRLRDGTASWRALEIERILLQEKVINEPLSHDAVLALAQAINRKWMYSLRHDRPAKYYYQEMESILNTYGVLDIPIYVWFKLKEIIDQRIEPREFGLRMSLGVQASGEVYHWYWDYPGDSAAGNRGEHGARPRLVLTSAYPLSYRWQFDENLEIFYNNGLSFGFSTIFTYLVHYNLSVKLYHHFDYKYHPEADFYDDTEKRIMQDIRAIVYYYIEDRFSISWHTKLVRYWNDERTETSFSTGLQFGYDLF